MGLSLVLSLGLSGCASTEGHARVTGKHKNTTLSGNDVDLLTLLRFEYHNGNNFIVRDNENTRVGR